MSHRRVGTSTGNAEADMNAARREGQSFQLRAQGYSFDEIAAKCGYATPSGAYKAYKRFLARIPKRSIDEMRETILEQQMQALKAMQKRLSNGDTFAVDAMTRLHERMAKLFGLDKPVLADPLPTAQVIVREYPAEWVNALPPPPGAPPAGTSEPASQPETAA